MTDAVVDARCALPADAAPYRICDLAGALSVPSRRIARWIVEGRFPETPWWFEAASVSGNRRRFSQAMIDAAVAIAEELKLLGRPRWDLAQSDYGRRVAQAWRRTEAPRLALPVRWFDTRGWPDANPARITDLSTPEARQRYEISRLPQPVDDPVIDLSTDEARELNNRGTPRFVAS